jgi:hypothetical protein
MLLSRLMSPSAGGGDTTKPTAPVSLAASNITPTGMTLTWTASSDNIGVTAYELYSGGNLVNGSITGTSYVLSGLSCATTYAYTLKARDAAGNVSAPSNTINPQTAACPSSSNEIIYADQINAAWSDVSSACSVSPSNTTPVKTGTKSLKAVYSGYGKLSFFRSATLNTSAQTQLRFWVYNTSKNGLKVYTHNNAGVKGADYFYKPGTNKWIEVVITLGQLGNPASVSKVTLENNSRSGGTMYFDEIQLTSVTRTGLVVAQSLRSHPVFPNPTHHNVTIQYVAQGPGLTNLELIDNSGRIISRQHRDTQKGLNQWEFSFPDQRPGIYYLCIKQGAAVLIKPLTVR